MTPATLSFQEEIARTIEEAIPEDTGLGYMEFFDWLAGCSNKELIKMANEYDVHHTLFDLSDPEARYDIGLKIWAAM